MKMQWIKQFAYNIELINVATLTKQTILIKHFRCFLIQMVLKVVRLDAISNQFSLNNFKNFRFERYERNHHPQKKLRNGALEFNVVLASPDHRRDVYPNRHNIIGERFHVDGQCKLDARLSVQVDSGWGHGLNNGLHVWESCMQWKSADLCKFKTSYIKFNLQYVSRYYSLVIWVPNNYYLTVIQINVSHHAQHLK